MLQTTSRSLFAEPPPSSTPSSFPNSIFSAAGAPQLTPPPSASITPATTLSNPPAASESNSPVLAAEPAAISKRVADLTSTVHQLNQDNVRQISSTNELLSNKLFGQMIALVEERDGDKAARKAAEDRLAEVVASRAKAEEVLLKEREERRRAKSAWSRAYYSLEKENTNLQAAPLDMQAKTDFLQVEALQKALVRLGIVDPDDQQYPLAYPVCGDCLGPFLKAVCKAARQTARKAAEDRLAEVVVSRAKAEEVLLKEREERRKAKSAWSRAYYALDKENTDLQAALLDMQAKTDFLQIEALQKALVRLGIVDPDDQQYPLAYPVGGDCVGPFLKAVCTAARQGPQANSNAGPEHELATAAHRTFEGPAVRMVVWSRSPTNAPGHARRLQLLPSGSRADQPALVGLCCFL